MARSLVTGGRRLRQWVAKARRNARKPAIVRVGFFESSRYPPDASGKRQPVAGIAAAHEFGLADLPERAFLRRSVPESAPAVRKAIRQVLRGRSRDHPLALTPEIAQRAGKIVAERIRENIDALETPKLDPETVEAKGHKKPLIDTKTLRDSVEVRIGDGTGQPPRRAGERG